MIVDAFPDGPDRDLVGHQHVLTAEVIDKAAVDVLGMAAAEGRRKVLAFMEEQGYEPDGDPVVYVRVVQRARRR